MRSESDFTLRYCDVLSCSRFPKMPPNKQIKIILNARGNLVTCGAYCSWGHVIHTTNINKQWGYG